MKKQRILFAFIIALAFCLQMAVVSSAASTTLYFSEHEVDLGDEVTVTVTFRGGDIAGVGFNIDYDSSVLTYKGASGSGTTLYDNGKTVSNLESGTTDSYTVDFVFTANGKGSSQITINDVKVSDGNGDPIRGFDGASAKLEVVSANKPEEESTTKAEEKTTEEKTTEETSKKSEKPGEITLGGRTYTLVDDSAFVDAPDGFDETYSDYKGSRILTYTSKDKAQQIVCIMDDEGTKSFALFDDEKDTFSEYLIIRSESVPIILLAAKDNMIPSGFTPVNIEIGGDEIVAYENEQFKTNGICLIYGLSSSEGKAGLYIYDTNEGTLQKYYNVNTPAAPKAEEENTQTTTEAVIEANNDVEDNIPLKKSTMIKIICAVSAVLVAALIAVVTLAVKFRKKSSVNENEGEEIVYVTQDDDGNDIYFTE